MDPEQQTKELELSEAFQSAVRSLKRLEDRTKELKTVEDRINVLEKLEQEWKMSESKMRKMKNKIELNVGGKRFAISKDALLPQ